jgi:PAS domain S-box-containing protein
MTRDALPKHCEPPVVGPPTCRSLPCFCLAVLAAFGYSSPAKAQEPPAAPIVPHLHRRTVRVPVTDGTDIRFRRLSIAAGLSQTRAEQIIQDDQGFMWFGTQFGLNRYDGNSFKVFTPNPADATSISGAYIYSLFKDRANMLWIGCDQFLDRFDPTTERFTHYRLNNSTSDRVTASVQDRSGTLWLGTGNGLYGLEAASGHVVHHYTHDPRDESSLRGNEVKSILVDRRGTLLIAAGDDLEQFDQRTGRVMWRVPLPGLAKLFDPAQGPSYDTARASHSEAWLWRDSGDWQDGGLALLDRDADTLTYYSFYEQTSGKPLLLTVSALLQDTTGSVWLGGFGGLLRLDTEAGRAVLYHHRTDDPESLDNDRVIALQEDREGNIWVGLHAHEPDFFSTRKPSFSPLLRETLARNPLGEHMVSAIYENQGTLWVGASGNLIRTDRKTGQNTVYPLHDDVISITGDTTGATWVGTGYRGLFKIDHGNRHVETFPLTPSAFAMFHSQIVRIFIDHNGAMWLATRSGLQRFDTTTKRFTAYSRENGGTDEYYDIAEDGQGRLWLAGNTGLQRFDPATREFVVYEHRLDNPRSLSANTVSSVLVDHAGGVWAATYNGLAKLDQRSGEFKNYYATDGIASSRVSCVLEDRRGILWMSTARGISKFDPVSQTFRNYSISDGLPGLDLTGWVTCYKSPSGEMFFGGFSGAVSFFPNKIVDSAYVPPLAFTEFLLSGHAVAIGGQSPLSRSINYTNRITLPHDQNGFSLQFAALSFSSPSTIRYRYRLDSLDSEWREGGEDRRFVNYPKLTPGSYAFRVESSTGYGMWGQGRTLYIDILSPWWSTPWFRIASVITASLLFWGVYRLRIQQLRREETKLRNVIETVPIFAWTASPDGLVDFVNQHWENFTAMSITNSGGLGWQDAVHPEDRREFRDKWRMSMSSGGLFETEARYRRSDGQFHWFLTRAVPLRDAGGKIIKWYGTATDIEDRKRAQQLQADLAHLNRVSMLGEMAASLAHEIKQPLAAVITSANSCAQWLTHEPPNLERARAAAVRIDQYGNRATEIIDRIRSFYTKSPQQRDCVVVNQIIQEILAMLRAEATQHSVRIQTELAAGLPKIMGDQVQLQQVFVNLVLNAIEAMHGGGGVLTVKSELVGSDVVLSVGDTGEGLPCDNLDQIFSPFFTTKSHGSGMGLAISRSIVESHGGRLWATANRGRGALFQFSLPTEGREALPQG